MTGWFLYAKITKNRTIRKGGNRMKNVDKQQELLKFIKSHLEKYGYPPTVREMCRAIKVTSTSTISYHLDKLEAAGIIRRNPNKNRAIEVLLSDNDKMMNMKNYIPVPILGKITAGQPILAVENVEEYFMVSPNMFRGEGLFILTVSGTSMINAGIYDGDKIILRQQNSANNGDIVAAMIDGYATVKRFYKEDSRYRLQPENDTMAPIYTDHVDIIGKVVGLLRKF